MKRFTETGKWKDPWFRTLPPNLKLFWLYLCDECDIAGFWEPDLDLARFMLGASLDLNEALKAFNGRVEVWKNGRWHLTKFVRFQFGNLNPANHCHKGIIDRLTVAKNEQMTLGLASPKLGAEEEEEERILVQGGTGGARKRQPFVKPTAQELELQAAKIGLPATEVEKFLLHYNSNGWLVGKNPMKCWRSSLGGWKVRWEEKRAQSKPNNQEDRI